jgi:uncharacterized membrane protein (UPF0127 family)
MLRLVAPLSLLLLLAACPRAAGTAEVELAGHRFTVELAEDDASRSRGLMFRESMPADHGMLFVWPEDAPRAFWMKNTLIPLDILYFDGQRRLVDMHLDVQPCRTERCPSYASARPARYVLELNAGKARELELKLGDRLTIRRR